MDPSNPLFIHPSDHPGAQLVSTPFSGLGFPSWRRSMLIALSAKNKIGFINGKISKPNNDSPDLSLWERCNDMVISWILNSLSREIADSVIYITIASEIWSDLEERFGQTSGAQMFNLQKELSSLMQGNSDISTYYTKSKKLWDEISAIECIPLCTCGSAEAISKKLQDQRLIQFLMGLNEGYNNVRGNVLMMKPLPTLAQTYSLLVQEEKHKELKSPNGLTGDNGESMAFNVGNFSKSTSSGNYVKAEKGENKRVSYFCNHCKRSGHTEDRCWKKHGYPSNFKGNNRSAGRKFAAVVDTNEGGSVNKDEDSKMMIRGLSNEHCTQLIQLLNHIQGGKTQITAASTENKGKLPSASSANLATSSANLAGGKKNGKGCRVPVQYYYAWALSI